MSLGQAMRAYLIAQAPVDAKVGSRVYRVRAGQKVTGDRVVYQRISGTPYRVVDGTAALHQERYQLNCWGTGNEAGRAAEEVATVVKAALLDYRGQWQYTQGVTTRTFTIRSCRIADVRDLDEPPGDAGDNPDQAVAIDVTVIYSVS